ncbi:hypothetical protein [Priestia aryabhattai]
MDKESLLSQIRRSSHRNHFSMKIVRSSISDERMFDNSLEELQINKKIKVKEFQKEEDTIYLAGILKYASE